MDEQVIILIMSSEWIDHISENVRNMPAFFLSLLKTKRFIKFATFLVGFMFFAVLFFAASPVQCAEARDKLEFLRREATQGNAKAQFQLGVKYDNGQGVAQDHGQAVVWYRKAAEQGLVEAQLLLGAKYDNGQGVAQDHGQAVVWYRKAAEQGFAEAQYFLGIEQFRFHFLDFYRAIALKDFYRASH